MPTTYPVFRAAMAAPLSDSDCANNGYTVSQMRN